MFALLGRTFGEKERAKQNSFPLFRFKEKFSLDRADLTQTMIIIGGFAVAAILAIASLAGVMLAKGEWTANCISNASAFQNEGELSREDCATRKSGESGEELCFTLVGDMHPVDDGFPVEECVNAEDYEKIASQGYGCTTIWQKDRNGNIVHTEKRCELTYEQEMCEIFTSNFGADSAQYDDDLDYCNVNSEKFTEICEKEYGLPYSEAARDCVMD